MSTTATVTEKIAVGGTVVEYSNTYTEDGYIALDPQIADSGTDIEVILSCDLADIATMYIVSDQDVTLEVNDGAGAGGTISLVVGVPLIWGTNSYVSLADLGFSADITGFFFTNASGSTANINIRIVHDSSQE